MSYHTNEILRSVSVEIDENARLDYFRAKDTYIEPPVQVGEGIYDVDFVGGFTCLGGRQSYLRHISIIGRFCAIAHDVVAGPAEHPANFLSPHPVLQGGFKEWRLAEVFHQNNREMIARSCRAMGSSCGERFGKIEIGNDVWIGQGAFIRRGVKIGDGAIVGARAVVVKDVEPYAIVGGAPARLIRYRFDKGIIADLMALRWWRFGLSALGGVDFTDIRQAIARIDRNIATGEAQLYQTPLVHIDPAGLPTLETLIAA